MTSASGKDETHASAVHRGDVTAGLARAVLRVRKGVLLSRSSLPKLNTAQLATAADRIGLALDTAESAAEVPAKRLFTTRGVLAFSRPLLIATASGTLLFVVHDDARARLEGVSAPFLAGFLGGAAHGLCSTAMECASRDVPKALAAFRLAAPTAAASDALEWGVAFGCFELALGCAGIGEEAQSDLDVDTLARVLLSAAGASAAQVAASQMMEAGHRLQLRAMLRAIPSSAIGLTAWAMAQLSATASS
jgi:hypothetical protein